MSKNVPGKSIPTVGPDEVRYTVALPPHMAATIKTLSHGEGTTFKAAIIGLLRIGLFVMKAQDRGAEIIQRFRDETGKLKEVFIKFIY